MREAKNEVTGTGGERFGILWKVWMPKGWRFHVLSLLRRLLRRMGWGKWSVFI